MWFCFSGDLFLLVGVHGSVTISRFSRVLFGLSFW